MNPKYNIMLGETRVNEKRSRVKTINSAHFVFRASLMQQGSVHTPRGPTVAHFGSGSDINTILGALSKKKKYQHYSLSPQSSQICLGDYG